MAKVTRIQANLYQVEMTHNTDDAPVKFYATAQDLLDLYEFRLRNASTLLQEAHSQPTPRTWPGEQVPGNEGQKGADWFYVDDVSDSQVAALLEEVQNEET
jgi:hypothetical protein